MGVRVSVVCRNWEEDRVLPRMARYLRDRLGWSVGAAPDPRADVVYWLAYFEAQKVQPWPTAPTAAFFTHREEEPPGNAKARLFDEVARRVDLRVAMCRLYGDPLAGYGPTIVAPLPVERERFEILRAAALRMTGVGRRPVVGLSGYTYANHRKGEDLVRGIVTSKPGLRAEWRGSGRGWPAAVPTRRFSWAEMPGFYQGLDVLVCPSRVEGGPMPVLEALACGVRVVAPRGVGVLDEIGSGNGSERISGLYRYERGDLASMILALELALDLSGRDDAEREGLRAVVAGHSVEGFVEAHGVMAQTATGQRQRMGTDKRMDAVDAADGVDAVDGGIGEIREERLETRGVDGMDEVDAQRAESGGVEAAGKKARRMRQAVRRGTGQTRGIYCVAFGDPAREACLRMMTSAKRHMPDVPICLCAAKKIGPEDVLVKQPDSDVGGRRAKLRAYELAPAEWQAVLYLDADTEVVAPIYRFFEWVEDGWEFVITKDPHLMDTMSSFKRPNNRRELADVERTVKTLNTLQFNGGVWAFARNERVARFFQRWQAEWEVHAQRDQGALIRAMYADPLKVWLLGNEWNTFPKYTKGIKTAGLMHYPGDARRWDGLIPGRIDSPEAWAMVRKHEAGRRG